MQRINSVILGLLLACPAFAQSPRIERFAMHEIELAAEGQYANPYTDLTADASITPPNGGQPRNAALFWDGGAKWKLRIAPDEVGAWKWTVKSRDRGLDGKSGTFECVAGSRRGSIRPMKDHPLHFERQDGSPFWFLGDTAWALYTDSEKEKHDRAAALAYLNARAAQGFNVLHSMLLSEAGWGNRGGQPFDDIAAEKLNPGFWQEVDFRLAHANAKGIVCGLALAWGDKGRNEGFAWRQFADTASRQRYARYVVARYGAYDTYFLVSGEWHAEIRSRKDTADAVRNEFIEIGNAAAAVDPQRRMMAIHPMTAEGSVREYNAAKWMSFGDYQQNYRDLHGRLLMSRSANKPVVNSEYGYFLRDQSGDGVPDKDNSTSLAAMRHATWDIAMAGGYVVTGFGTTYFGGNRDPGPFDLETAKNKPWQEQIGHVKSIFSQLQWWKLQPHDDLLACETPRGEEGKEFERLVPPAATYWCLAEPGRQYLVYFRGLKSPLTLALQVNPGQLTATQINPRTGERRVLGGASTERFEIRPPDDQDWAVLISAPAERVERAGQGRIHYVTYRSQLNDQDVPVMVYTPPGYETSGERYPVVYNLHGAGGGNPARQWDRIQATLIDAMDHAKARPVIYVFVNGLGDTFFVDSADQKLPVESSIVQELIPLIDKNYRTIAGRDGRAVDGFSMGGFGCLMLALKHPDLFSSVVSYGAALISAERAGIGTGKRFASREHFDRYSPSTLVEKNADTIRRGLKIRLVCGDADSLHASNVEFTKLLSRLNIPVSWVSVPGVGHDTKGLYQRVGLESLHFMEASFQSRSPTPQGN